MNKKALIVTTISGFVPQFEMGNVRILQEMGFEVHYATNLNQVSYGKDNSRLEGTGIVLHQIDFDRSPYNVKGLKAAYRQLLKLLKEEHFELVHCHNPVGAVVARLAAKKYNKTAEHRMKVMYTAHGFHFLMGRIKMLVAISRMI